MLKNKMEKSNLLLGILAILISLGNSEQTEENSQRNSKVCKYDTSSQRLTNLFRPLLQLSKEFNYARQNLNSLGSKHAFLSLLAFDQK